MSIRCLKTSLGEDLIGNIDTTMDGSYTIEKPMQIVMAPQQGGFGFMMIPYLPFAETKKFVLSNEHVRFVFDPVIEMRNQYVQLTTNLTVTSEMPPNIGLVK